jgi:Protein of unknown function (DUF4446)
VDDFSSAPAIVAVAAAGVAALALVLALVLAFRLRRVRSSQKAILGEDGATDLVAHASGLQTAFVQLRDWVEDTARGLEQRMGSAEERIDGCVAYRSLVRYDAYGEMSGHQSTSLALLDTERNGVVLSCITNRESARLYCKVVQDGRGEHELSPEEDEAIRLALAGEPSRTVTLD